MLSEALISGDDRGRGSSGIANLERLIAKGGIVKTLIIEDDPVIVESIYLAFQIHWPEAQLVPTRMGRKGIELARCENPDIIILDLSIPDVSGIYVLEQIRLFSSVPIIILTIKAEEADIFRLLESGADDYIVKPCGQPELLARVKARILDKEHFAEEPSCSFGSMNFDASTCQFQHGEEVIKLTAIEAHIICHLMKQAGQVATYSSLVKDVWGEDFPGSVDSLMVYMKRLRNKLETAPDYPRIIIDKPGTGYFLAEPG